MIRAAIERILQLAPPHVFAHDGLSYVNSVVHPLSAPDPDEIKTCTLSGLLECLAIYDSIPVPFFIHVLNHKTVMVKATELTNYGKRPNYVQANYAGNEFQYNGFMEIEKFNIGLQAFFVFDQTVEAILKVTGNIVHEASIVTNDNGISQTVTAKTGISRTGNVVAPTIVNLRPYRTFSEVAEQPLASFVLRLRQDEKTGAAAGLFEADTGLWKVQAIASIKSYLREGLVSIQEKTAAIEGCRRPEILVAG